MNQATNKSRKSAKGKRLSIHESMAVEMKEANETPAPVPVKKTTWELITGRKVEFTEIIIPAADVEKQAKVHKHNRRIQSEANKKSLERLVRSIKRQQYYPCVVQKVGDSYLIYDGSRRRLAAIKAGVELKVMYCDEELTSAEAKAITKELQSSENHTYRDHGCQYELLMQDPEFPMTVEEILEEEEISKTHFDRCMVAWSVPASLIDLFEDPTHIPHAYFAKLLKVSKKYLGEGELEIFVKSIEIEEGTTNDKVMALIFDTAELNKPKDLSVARKIVDVSKEKFVKIKSLKNKTNIEITTKSKAEISDIEELIVQYYKDKSEQ